MARLGQVFRIGDEDIVAFGDDLIDINMLVAAGTGVAQWLARHVALDVHWWAPQTPNRNTNRILS